MVPKVLTKSSFPRNTFVLEYCGEVLDHKEFKTRVKEYARNKNIHYYFMSLKNNEVSEKLAQFMIFITVSSRRSDSNYLLCLFPIRSLMQHSRVIYLDL